jgi:hypothetical protein
MLDGVHWQRVPACPTLQFLFSYPFAFHYIGSISLELRLSCPE